MVNLISIIFKLQLFLVFTVNSLIKNVYVTNGLHSWHMHGYLFIFIFFEKNMHGCNIYTKSYN